jgi:hypothetical protein
MLKGERKVFGLVKCFHRHNIGDEVLNAKKEGINPRNHKGSGEFK